jgi:hypothetical protein
VCFWRGVRGWKGGVLSHLALSKCHLSFECSYKKEQLTENKEEAETLIVNKGCFEASGSDNSYLIQRDLGSISPTLFTQSTNSPCTTYSVKRTIHFHQ